MKTGHPTPGHFLAIIILVLLPVAYYARAMKFLGKGWEYLQIGAMYTTLFLSMIPTIVETLTRLPISHPIASDPAAPFIKMALFFLIAVYIGRVAYQLLKLKKTKRLAPSADVPLNSPEDQYYCHIFATIAAKTIWCLCKLYTTVILNSFKCNIYIIKRFKQI